MGIFLPLGDGGKDGAQTWLHGFRQPDHKTLGPPAPQVPTDPCSPTGHGSAWLSKRRLDTRGCQNPLLPKNHVLWPPACPRPPVMGRGDSNDDLNLPVSFINSRNRAPPTGPSAPLAPFYWAPEP